MTTETFGKWLKRRRSGLGLTQPELAQRIGYAWDTVQKVETDKLRPSKAPAAKLAEALELPPEQHAAFIRFARDEGDLPDLPTQTASVPPRSALDASRSTSAPVPHNLPHPPTPLVGREDELAALTDLLAAPDVRLVTLTGPGGSGKTRLALEVARALTEDGGRRTEDGRRGTASPQPSALSPQPFPDGAFFVNLAPVTDPPLVVSAVAQALGVHETSGQPLLDTLTAWLRPKRLLLLLDNFEQVIPAAPLVTDLLAHAPDLTVLVTSRETLRLRGEHAFPLAPLPLPDLHRPTKLRPQDPSGLAVYTSRVGQSDAVRLFLQRAQAVKPGFALTPANAPTLAEVCVRLDGLPLALELAAARIRLLTPEQMLARFEGLGGHTPLGLLKTGTLDLPLRHQTLWRTIEWSYDLLTPTEQALFRRLAVFVGGWSLEAAEAVGATKGELEAIGPAQVLDGLESLLDKSLITETRSGDGEVRFGMLETIREFALARLAESGLSDVVRECHAEFFLALAEQAEQAMPRAEALWMARMQPEVANLRAALTWFRDAQLVDRSLRLATAVWPFWRKQGNGQEGRRWLQDGLQTSDGQVSMARARALCAAGYAALTYFDVEAVSLFEASVAAYRALGNRKGQATALGWLAVSYREAQFDLARERATEAVTIARELGDPQTVTDTLHRLGDTAFSLDDMDTAAACYEEALALDRQLGDQANIAYMLYALGHIAMRRGDLPLARSRYEQALATWGELGDQMGLSWALGVLAYLLRLEGDYGQARALSEQALALDRRLDRKAGISHQLENLGRLELREGKLDTAEEMFSEALILLHQVNDRRCPAHTLEALAELAMARGQRERAARLFGSAEAARQAIHNRLLPWERAEHDSKIATAQAYLDNPTFAAAWAEGQAMTLEEAVALALREET